jgi:ABC-type multidrug transport system fused ATPase/permease subunit
LNFKIDANDTFAFVGKTGAGKSSILSLIFGFRKPSSGKILINGIDIATLSVNSVRDNISYVNQNAGTFNVSIKDNILYGLEYNKEKYDESVALAHCEFIVEFPKKDDYIVGENGKKLSGGQRQRLALARALYKNASLFVLDEATSALDANTENMIQESLQHIMKSKTTIIVAHRLNTIKNADKVLVMSVGQIVESGSYDEVSKTEAFKNNFGLEK